MKADTRTKTVCRFELTDDEVSEVDLLLRDVARRYETVEDRRFIAEARVIADDLPVRLRKEMNEFRLTEPSGAIHVIGLNVDEAQLVPTPAHWKAKPVPSPTLTIDVFFFLCASLLGDAVGWSTQQDAYIMHDVLPIKESEWDQLGSGSLIPLSWHTEDAFHPYRADYVGLMCLRNPDKVATTIACIDDVRIPPDVAAVMMSDSVYIRPDESHLPKNRPDVSTAEEGTEELLERAYDRIERMNQCPEPVAVLFGDPTRPYIRIDPDFSTPRDENAVRAFDALKQAIEDAITPVALQPGEMLFLDNYLTVHGRVAFQPRYNGTDRWLRRLNLVRNLRTSRDARLTADSRIIF